MNYQELHDIAYQQEKHHFTQVVATGGSEHHREQLAFWQAQRQKAAALWTAQRDKPHDPDRAARPEPAPTPEPEPKGNVGVDGIRTYPDLSQHCLAQRLDLPLRLWYILRQHNSDVKGDGWLTESEILDLSIGNNKRQTRAWLKRGQGVFWHRHGRRYRLAGLGAVVAELGVTLPKPCVPIPREHLEGLEKFRAALYASWFVYYGDDGITISQAALGELFGRSPRTLQRWAAVAGLGVSHNLAAAPLPESKEAATKRYKNGMPRYPAGTLAAMGWTDDGDHQQKGKPKKRLNLVWFERGDNGDLVLVWKMSNTYAMAWRPGPKTTLQKSASKRAPVLRATGANVKMYFGKGARGGAVAKAIERDQGPVYLETGRHNKTGDVLWSKQA